MIETESSARLSVEEKNFGSMDQKHSSRVAKVHYQNLRSRDVSIKPKGLLKNLIDQTSNEKTVLCNEWSTASNTCEVASDVNVCAARISGNEASNTTPYSDAENDVESSNKPGGICHTSITTVHAEEEMIAEVKVQSASRGCSKSPFSQQEDSCLKKGLSKYGNGHWTSTLNGKDYSFRHIGKQAVY